jgi:hypothetical protein|tara:strand:+ start:456 stop:725 length:270 start_codon:yes stop_codon:yes gene_type:complete
MKKKKLEARRSKQAIEKKDKFKKKIIWALAIIGVSVGCAFFLSEKKEKITEEITETIIEKSVESSIDKAADKVKEKAVEKITNLINNKK